MLCLLSLDFLASFYRFGFYHCLAIQALFDWFGLIFIMERIHDFQLMLSKHQLAPS